jgi:hypothetical protein
VTSDEFPVLPLADLTTDGIRAACRTSTAPILGLGGMTGSINAAPVIQTSRVVDASEADIALLPLAGFEWLELLSDLPAAVLSRLPQVIQGSLIVLRRDHLMSGVSQSPVRMRLGPFRPARSPGFCGRGVDPACSPEEGARKSLSVRSRFATEQMLWRRLRGIATFSPRRA